MKVALFGAGGFLGRAVARELTARGHEAAALTRADADIEVPDALARLELDADAVINCAARVPSEASTLAEHAAMFATNAVGAAQVAQWAVARGIRRIVHGSTLVVVARPWPVPLTEDAPTYPLGPVAGYAAAKLGGELVAASIAAGAGATCAVLRLSALYGPAMAWTGVLPTFVDAALAGKRPRAVRGAHADFLHVDDAARAMVRAAEVGATGVIHVASGAETSIARLAAVVLGACGRPVDEVDVADSPVARAVVDLTRMRERIGVGAEVTLERGVSELVASRRAS